MASSGESRAGSRPSDPLMEHLARQGLSANSESLFRTLLDNLHEGVYFVDPDRRILYWNHAAEEITGFTEDEVLGTSCADGILMHADEAGNVLCHNSCPMRACMDHGGQARALVYLHHKEGHRVPVQIAASAIHDDAGNVIGGLETFYDATSTMAAVAEIEQLKELSLLCPLTGVGNRRYAEQTLRQRIEEMQRNGSQLAVLFLDIDHFKTFNDTHGHATGDLVLQMTARTLAGAMRSYDFLGRWGGEEFVAILPNMKPGDVAGFADRLRSLVQHSTREMSSGKVSVTVSIGAHICRPGDTPETAVAAADTLMYESKRRGRNTVTVDAE